MPTDGRPLRSTGELLRGASIDERELLRTLLRPLSVEPLRKVEWPRLFSAEWRDTDELRLLLPEYELLRGDELPLREPENELLRLLLPEYELPLRGDELLRLLLPENELLLRDDEPEYELPLRGDELLRDDEPEYELLLRDDEPEYELPLRELDDELNPPPPPRELLDDELWLPPCEPPPRPWANAGVALSAMPSARIAINLLVFIMYPFFCW